MEIRHTEVLDLNNALRHRALKAARTKRNFNAVDYIEKKTNLLNDYMAQYGLKAVVVAVSGGIDSAIVYKLAQYAAAQKDSPIEKVVGITLPCTGSNGVTGQGQSKHRAQLLDNVTELNLNNTYDKLVETFEYNKVFTDLHIADTKHVWAAGQVVSYLRTPFYYYATSLLTAAGFPAVVLGTTNRSEGSYLGYFGKASDGMVDIQLISDLYKSEVYQVGQALEVPQQILDIAPTGDMFDAAPDEQVFGFTYDALELILEEKAGYHIHTTSNACQTNQLLVQLRKAVEDFHNYNKHKYLACSPAVHLDLFDVSIEGGWKFSVPEVQKRSKVNGEIILVEGEGLTFYLNNLGYEVDSPFIASVGAGTVQGFTGLLSEVECQNITEFLEENGNWIPVDENGYKDNVETKVGSYRTSVFDPEFAELLWERVKNFLPTLVYYDKRFDHPGTYKPVGVSNLMRFIKYEDGQTVLPHYDAPYEFENGDITMKSLVVYIDGEGDTRFINNHQHNLEFTNKDLNDWNRTAGEDEVIFNFKGKSGHAVAFDHRILHDGAPVKGHKLILRTDIVFKKLTPVTGKVK